MQKGTDIFCSLILFRFTLFYKFNLPYQEEAFSKYRNESAQEFRFVLSEQIRKQVFLASFVKTIETHIKSNVVIKALKHLL